MRTAEAEAELVRAATTMAFARFTQGVVVSDELRRLEKRLFDSDWAEARERLGRDPLVTELSRTSDQRRADALVEMAKRSSGADGTTPGPCSAWCWAAAPGPPV